MKVIVCFMIAALMFICSPKSFTSKSQSRLPASQISYTFKCFKALEPYSFRKFITKSKVIDGVFYPRTNNALFRGIKNEWEINPTTFVQTIADETIFYRALAYDLYRKELLGFNGPKLSSEVQTYLSYHGMGELFRGFQTCVNDLPEESKEAEASYLAAHLIDETYRMHEKKGHLSSRYLEYKSKYYIDFINKPGFNFSPKENVISRGEMIFTSNRYSQAAAYATTYIVGFNDTQERAIDLNYYNYEFYKAGWIHHINDTDEFVQPGYFTGNEIRYLSDLKNGYDLLKIELNNVPMIAVIKNAKSIHRSISNPQLIDTSKEKIDATLLGVITFCKPKKECLWPEEIASRFREVRSLEKLERNFMNSLSRISLNGAKATYLYKAPESIKVTKATYGSFDVTKETASFCDKKEVCEYKISQKFLFANPIKDFQEEFKVSWTCELSKRSKTKTVDSPAENQTLTLDCAP